MLRDFLQRHPLLRRAALALVVYFCFHGAVLESRAGRQYREAANWPATQAVISSSDVYWTSYSWSGKHNRYCPKLAYKYTVGSHTYDENNRVFDFVCWPDAYDFVAKHQPGATIRIAYDPNDPTISFVPDSVRDPGYPWGDIIGGMFFTAVLFADVFGAWTRESEPQVS
jgi:hypothetical protein